MDTCQFNGEILFSGFLARNRFAWPTLFLLNVSTALKGLIFIFLFIGLLIDLWCRKPRYDQSSFPIILFWVLLVIVAAGVVLCGCSNKSPRTSSLVQIGPL